MRQKIRWEMESLAQQKQNHRNQDFLEEKPRSIYTQLTQVINEDVHTKYVISYFEMPYSNTSITLNILNYR